MRVQLSLSICPPRYFFAVRPPLHFHDRYMLGSLANRIFFGKLLLPIVGTGSQSLHRLERDELRRVNL